MKNIGAVLLWMVVCADLFAQNGPRMEGMNPSRTNVSSASGPVLQPAFDVIASNVWGSVKRIGLDGSLILSDGATVSSYDTRGRQRWRENIMDVLNGGIADLAIAPSGVVYASSADALIALDPPIVARARDASSFQVRPMRGHDDPWSLRDVARCDLDE